MGKEPACNAGDMSSILGVERAQQPIPVFLPGESHGQRSVVGYSPMGCKELHTTKAMDCEES